MNLDSAYTLWVRLGWWSAVLAVAAGPAFGAGAAVRQLPGFPVQVEGPVKGSVAIADLDGDGRVDLVVAAGSFVFAFSGDGKPLPGFPIDVGSAVMGSVAVADVDRDGKAEVLAIGEAGQVVLVNGQGEALPGFPTTLKGGARAGGTLANLDGRRGLEVVVGGRDGKLHAFDVLRTKKKLKELPGFPVNLGVEVTSSPAVGDIGRESPKWVAVVGTENGTLHVVGSDGKPVSGFPAKTKYQITGAPAIGDVDGDGVADIVVTSQDFSAYAFNDRGELLRGFPVASGYRIKGGPALVDLDGDAVPEVVWGSVDSKLYAVDGRGRALPGFPVTLRGKLESAVVAGDVNKDGAHELIVASTDGTIHVLTAKGKPLRRFKVNLGPLGASPSLADVDGDGALDIVVGTLGGRVVALRVPAPGKAVARIAWGTEGHDAGRSGRRHPNQSAFVDPKIEPAAPTTASTLVARWTYMDLDRDKEGKVELRWKRNGKVVPELAGKREVPADQTAKGERWQFTVRSRRDGSAARRFESSVAEIGNTPPSRPTVRLQPATPATGDPLRAIAQGAADEDGDRLTYEYEWWRDGRSFDLPKSAAVVPKGIVRRAEHWEVVVRATDGEGHSPPTTASALVKNTAPARPRIELLPAQPRVTDKLTVRISASAKDRDRDPVTQRVRWKVRGVAQGLSEQLAELPAGIARKGDEVFVTVAGWDGSVEGAAVTAKVTVRNTPPTEPKVALWPARPVTGQKLRAALTAPAHDPDEDPIRYTFEWTRSGQKTSFTTDEVPADQVHAGQRWSVSVWAHDDESTSPAASASVTVVNSPPRPPTMAIDPPAPHPGERLEAVVVVRAADRDADELTLAHRWEVLGVTRVRGPRVESGVTKKGERWVLVVTPNDGKVTGDEVRASVAIGNRPPGPPKVTLSPKRPVGGTAIEAVVVLAADPDGDRVTPRLRWLLDGRPQSDLDDRTIVPASRVKRDQVWTVQVRGDDGEARSRANQAATRVGDRPAVAARVKVSPARPTTVDPLRCVVTRAATDPDGDRVKTTLSWLADGVPTGHRGEAMPARATRRGQRWSCVASARSMGRTVEGTPSATVEVVNAGPGTLSILIEPVAPRAADDLQCRVTAAAQDEDGDPLTLEYAWKLDGRRTRFGSATVPARATRKGQKWSCEVRAGDGRAWGTWAQVEVTVVNTPPTAPVVELIPAAGGGLRCNILRDATDVDRDRPRYQFRWYLEGLLQPFAYTSVEVRGRLVKAGQRWQCAVLASDGAESGPEGRSRELHIARGAAGRKQP